MCQVMKNECTNILFPYLFLFCLSLLNLFSFPLSLQPHHFLPSLTHSTEYFLLSSFFYYIFQNSSILAIVIHPFPSFCPLQVFWALQLVTVLVPGAVFHLYAACKNIDQEEILERPIYTVFYIISVLLRIILEVIAFWLQSHLFGFQVCTFLII